MSRHDDDDDDDDDDDNDGDDGDDDDDDDDDADDDNDSDDDHNDDHDLFHFVSLPFAPCTLPFAPCRLYCEQQNCVRRHLHHMPYVNHPVYIMHLANAHCCLMGCG